MPSRAPSPSSGLLSQRDQEVLNGSIGYIPPSANSSPRRRWSPRSNTSSPRRWSPSSGGGSPNRRAKSSSPRRSPRLRGWTPVALSGVNIRRRKNYEELVLSTDENDGGDERVTQKENASPMAVLSLDGIPVPSLPSSRQESSPISPHISLPSPSARPRFSLGKLRLPGVQTKASENDGRNLREQSVNSPLAKPTPHSKPSPVFRFEVTTMEDGTEAVVPEEPLGNIDKSKDSHDDFDMLVKERLSLNTSVSGRAKTGLHDLCGSMCTLDDVLRAKTFLRDNLQMASKLDTEGRTPMHLFSNNRLLSSAVGVPDGFDSETIHFIKLSEQATFDPDSNLEKLLQHFLVGELLSAHPAGMVVRDDEGNVPFEKALTEWVQVSHQRGTSNAAGLGAASQFSYSNAMSQVWDSTVKVGRRTSMLVSSGFNVGGSPAPGRDLEAADESRSAIFLPERRELFGKNDEEPFGDELKDKSFPSFVRLSPHARFSLTMLSALVDQLDQYYLSPRQRHAQKNCSPTIDAECYVRARKALRELKDHSNVASSSSSSKITDDIIEIIASIPDLMQTILLIENDEDREFALSTSIVQQVMVNKKSVGSWMTQILQSRDRRLAQRAVDYLKTVSDRLTDKSTDTASSTSGNYENNSMEMIDEVSQLHDFVPSLLALGDRGIEDASTTFIVRKVLDRMISRPFVVSVIICDAIFLAVLIVAFRTAVNKVISGAPLSIVLKWIYVANTGIFYFIIREIGKTVSLFLISKRARKYFLSFWNVTDLLAIVLALSSTITIRYHFTILENGLENTDFMRGLLAVATGFLWLRVLSLLKGINMQLATFVLAIIQITKDILWFCVILLTLVVSFSQIFYTMLAPNTCAVGTGSEMECKPTEYLLRVYTILLGDFGDFEREQFKTGFSVFLVVFFSFLVTVVLLNVLIAVASDSYEKCLLRSQHLFGRARVMLVAELVSFQSLLKSSDKHASATGDERLYTSLWSGGRFFRTWSKGSKLFFSLSGVVIVGWTLAEILGYASGERHANILMSLTSVFVNVALFAFIIAFLMVSSKNDSSKGRDGIVQQAMLHLLGASRESYSKKMGHDAYEWKGRVHYLQEQMNRIATEHRDIASQQSRAMENMVNQSESRLKAEIDLLESNFLTLKHSILDEVKGTKRTNQDVTLAVEELKNLISMAASSTYRSPVPSEVDVDQNRVIPHGQQRQS